MSADDHAATPSSDRCPCGFDGSAVPLGDLAVALVDGARQWAEFLGAVTDYPGGLDDLRDRPERGGTMSWSAIEYACHVRDVVSVFARRIELSLLSHNPSHQAWDPVPVAEGEHYREQHPAAVADDIARGAREFADLLQPLTPTAWERTGVLDGRSTTVADLARTALHEVRHHLDDARVVVPAPTG